MFEFLGNIFNAILYQPLFNFLIFIYNYLPGHNFGLVVIVVTVLIKLVLYPVAVKALASQKAIQRLQPQVQALQHKYKDDKEAQAKETLELYRKENINPFSGLFLAVIQLPILIALYSVFRQGLKPEALNGLYSFVANPGHINSIFFAGIDLAQPNLIFAVGAAIFQFFQTKMLLPKEAPGDKKSSDFSVMMQKQMIYFFPILTIVILYKLPSALALYWIVSGVVSIVQQYMILRKIEKETKVI